MMKYKILVFILCIFLSVGTASANIWVSNSTLVDGLPEPYGPDPEIFYNDSTLKLIYGYGSVQFYGYDWNGTGWNENSTVVSGLPTDGVNLKITVFTQDGQLKSIVKANDNMFPEEDVDLYRGYDWNGSSWVSNSSVVSGLPTDDLSHHNPFVFYTGGIYRMVTGWYDYTIPAYTFKGYDWNGTGWNENSTIITGLAYTRYPVFSGYETSGIYKIVVGENDGVFTGYDWNGSGFDSNSSLVTGLIDYGYESAPTIYNDSGFKMIYGSKESNGFYGFYLNSIPTTTFLMTESQINPTQIYTNTSTPYFNWTYSDDDSNTQYSWEIQVGTTSGASDMWASGQLVCTDSNDIYAGSALSRNTTYYVQVRTNDGYENSSWATGTFKINALPVVSNVVITPSPAVDTDDLTAGNDTATDGNGDTITLYYRWYKDDVLQTALNDIVTINSSNLTTGDVWKVGIIPNDGYENGTQVYSATVTIGSSNVAPTLTGIQSNLTTRKYNKSVTISSISAYDADNDNYTLHIGTATGLSDLCNSSSTPNSTEASCNFLIPWTSGIHTIYGRLTDQNDTSIEYTEVITIDVTPPSIDSSSVNPSKGTSFDTYKITASVSVANGSISSVKVCVGLIGYSCTNYIMNLSGADYIYNFTTGGAGSFVSTIYASDDSGNINSAAGPSMTIVTGEGAPSGGGGNNITINETTLGDLTLTPGRLDTYYILTGNEGTTSYRFVANRVIVSCTSELGRCEITDGYIVKVYYDVNRSMKAIEDLITISDDSGYTADAVVIVRIITLDSFIPFEKEIEVGEGLGGFLSVFFEVVNGVVIGIKTWFLCSLVGGLGFFGYKCFFK